MNLYHIEGDARNWFVLAPSKKAALAILLDYDIGEQCLEDFYVEKCKSGVVEVTLETKVDKY